jgi:hypothetical protein
MDVAERYLASLSSYNQALRVAESRRDCARCP